MESLTPVVGAREMKKAETLGERLKRLRKAANFTQERLAAETGLAVSNIRNWEQGHRTLNVFALFKISRTLGRKMEEFVDGVAAAGFSKREKGPGVFSERN
jgi:transcriptional regulator with XRE-family HTH domain